LELVRLAKVGDFDRVPRKSFRLLGRPVGIFKDSSGDFYAMEVGCKHQNVNLLEGIIDKNIVTCPAHGWRYDLSTGECIWGSKVCLRRHHLEVRGEDIYISLRPVE